VQLVFVKNLKLHPELHEKIDELQYGRRWVKIEFWGLAYWYVNGCFQSASLTLMVIDMCF